MKDSTKNIDEMDFKLICYEMTGLDKRIYNIRSDSYELIKDIKKFQKSMLYKIQSITDEIEDVRKMIKVIQKTAHKYVEFQNDETTQDEVMEEHIKLRSHRSNVIKNSKMMKIQENSILMMKQQMMK